MKKEDKDMSAILEEPLPALTPDLLREIGEALGGRHWQADIAREANVSKSQITRYLNGSRTPTYSFGYAFDRILVDKIDDVTRYIANNGSPNKTNSKYKLAKRYLKKALSILRKISPKVKRAEIISERTEKPGKKPGTKNKKKRQSKRS